MDKFGLRPPPKEYYEKHEKNQKINKMF